VGGYAGIASYMYFGNCYLLLYWELALEIHENTVLGELHMPLIMKKSHGPGN